MSDPGALAALAAPRISVGIPLYNRRALIGPAITSALAQEHPPFEIIVVDDGSTDGSGEVVQALARTHPRVRYLRQDNAGSAAARNRLLEEFEGDWIAFLDSDDQWTPQKLSAAVELMRADRAVEFVHSNRAHCWPDGRRDDGRVDAEPARMAEPAYLLGGWRTKTSTLMLSRPLVDRLRPHWFKPLPICEDYELIWRAAVIARKIAYAPRVDTLVLMTDDGLSRARDVVRHHRFNIAAMNSAIEWMRSRGGLDAHVAILEQRRYREWQALIAAQYGDGARGVLVAACQCMRELRPVRGLKAVLSATLAARRSDDRRPGPSQRG